MITLNVSFGIYAFLPQGWLFMAAIILIECLALSYLFTKSWRHSLVCKSVILANVISGIIGIITSLAINGGWWLVVWFPWVSANEVGGGNAMQWLGLLYFGAFIVSVIIETLVNYLMLRKAFEKSIFKNTFLVNLLSYLVGSLAMYTYSF